MIGSGTINEPYLVNTFGDFITAVGVSDAYVSITGNINVAEDRVYCRGYANSITFSCAEVQGNGYMINNAITTNTNPIIINPSCHIENLNLYSWNTKNVGSVNCVIQGNPTATINNCSFSIFAESTFDYVKVVDGGIFTNCDIYVNCVLGSRTVIYSANTALFDFTIGSSSNNIEIYGMHSKTTKGQGRYNSLVTNCNMCSITGEITYSLGTNADAPGYHYHNITVFNNCQNSCSSVKIIRSFSYSADAAYLCKIYGDSCTNCIFDIDLVPPITGTPYGGGDGFSISGITRVTTQQMKSIDYLQSIGFWSDMCGIANISNRGFPYFLSADLPKQLGAFRGSSQLANVDISPNVETVGEWTFSDTLLENVVINWSCLYDQTSFPSPCHLTFYTDGGNWADKNGVYRISSDRYLMNVRQE